MKKELMKDLCKKGCLILMGFLIFNPTIFAQYQKSKTIEQTFPIEKGATININHQKGEVQIKRSNNNKIKARLDISIEGNYEKDVEALLEIIELPNKGNGTAQINLSTLTNIKSWESINGKRRVKMKDGSSLRGIEELHLDLVISIPDGVNLNLSNKYNDIIIEDFKGNLDLKNYNGNVQANNVIGNMKLDLKYGEATISDVFNCEVTLYESVLTLSNAKDFTINSKYSQHTISNINKGEFEAYEGEFTIGSINGNLTINDKYSEWSIGNCLNVEMKAYESDLNIGNAKALELDSKYSDFNIGSVVDVNFKKSFQDDMECGAISTFKSKNSKNLDLNIGTLKKGIYLTQDSHGDINVDHVQSSFEGAEIIGKNIDMELPMGNIKYQLNVDGKNMDISFENKKGVKSGLFQETNNSLFGEKLINGAKNNSPKITIKGMNIDVELD